MKKQSKRNTKPAPVPAPVVEVKDFWFESKIRSAARDLFGNTPTVNPALHETLLLAMFAKRECRRLSESEGGARDGKVFKSLGEAQATLKAALKEMGMSLIEAKQLARSVVVGGQRLFDVRHESEARK